MPVKRNKPANRTNIRGVKPYTRTEILKANSASGSKAIAGGGQGGGNGQQDIFGHPGSSSPSEAEVTAPHPTRKATLRNAFPEFKDSNKSRDKMLSKVRHRQQVAHRIVLAPKLPVKKRPSSSRVLEFAHFDVSSAELLASSLKAADGAWIGAQDFTDGCVRSLDELLGLGFDYVANDGGSPIGLVDAHGEMFGCFAAAPKHPSWAVGIADADNAMADALQKGLNIGVFDNETGDHRRGAYQFINCGLSFGGGQTEPMTLRKTRKEQEIINGLLDNDGIKRIAGYQSSMLPFYAPKMCTVFEEHLSEFYVKNPFKSPNFPYVSYFPAATFNLGPVACTADHVDYLNVAYGWCAITALGSFDHTRGGHLVLWSLKKIFEFPSGTTFMIPSALIRHGNTPVVGGGTRRSFTQYIAGGLFRWTKYGNQSWETLKTCGEAGRAWKEKQDSISRARGATVFSNVEELQADRDIFYGSPTTGFATEAPKPDVKASKPKRKAAKRARKAKASAVMEHD